MFTDDIERSVWKKPWLEEHDNQGAFTNLVQELRESDQESFRNYLRMGPEAFDYLTDKVDPLISKEDTNFHKAVSPAEKLAVTLRFFATGVSHHKIKY